MSVQPPQGIERYRHEALIYGSDEELLEVAVPFLRAGVEAGDPTFLRLEPRQEAAVLDAFGGGGRIKTLPGFDPHASVQAVREMHALVRDIVAAAARPVRILGSVPHAPWRPWARYEAVINALLEPLPLWGVCPYDTRTTPASVIDDVERTHPLRATPDLGGRENPQFDDALAFLNRREQEPDPIQSSPPDAELIDPAPVTAGNVAAAVAATTRLDSTDSDALRLAVTVITGNARKHGRPPVAVRIWSDADGVVATVTDAGSGPDLLRGILPDGPSPDESGSLYHVREAVGDVALFADDDGFTVRLVQRAKKLGMGRG